MSWLSGMFIQPTQLLIALIRPHFDKRMIGKNRRQVQAQLVCDLQHQRFAKAVVQIGSEIARLDVLPDRRLAAKGAQAQERVVAQEIIDNREIRL